MEKFLSFLPLILLVFWLSGNEMVFCWPILAVEEKMPKKGKEFVGKITERRLAFPSHPLLSAVGYVMVSLEEKSENGWTVSTSFLSSEEFVEYLRALDEAGEVTPEQRNGLLDQLYACPDVCMTREAIYGVLGTEVSNNGYDNTENYTIMRPWGGEEPMLYQIFRKCDKIAEFRSKESLFQAVTDLLETDHCAQEEALRLFARGMDFRLPDDDAHASRLQKVRKIPLHVVFATSSPLLQAASLEYGFVLTDDGQLQPFVHLNQVEEFVRPMYLAGQVSREMYDECMSELTRHRVASNVDDMLDKIRQVDVGGIGCDGFVFKKCSSDQEERIRLSLERDGVEFFHDLASMEDVFAAIEKLVYDQLLDGELLDERAVALFQQAASFGLPNTAPAACFMIVGGIIG